MWTVFAIFEDLGEQTWLDNEKARRTEQNWTYCRINGGWKPSEKLISFALLTVCSEKQKEEEEEEMLKQHFNISNSTRGIIQEKKKAKQYRA